MESGFIDDAKWSRAGFRISGDTLQPDEVTRALSIQPTNSGLKGGLLSSSPKRSPLRTSLWMLKSPLSEHESLDLHLQYLLDLLEPKREEIRELAKLYDIDFFCGFSSENGQGGCTFQPTLLERLAKLEVKVVLDLYPPGPIDLGTHQDRIGNTTA